MTSRTRRRTVTSLAVGLVLPVLSLLASTPVGSADDLGDRKDQVEDQIENAEEHLHHSSAELTAAEERLSGAVADLAAARTSLVQTRSGLAAAQALDERMQAELAEAVEDLSRARAALAGSRASVARRQDALRAIVVQQHASGGTGLMAISTVLSTQDTVDLTQQLTSYESVLDAQAATLSRLAASQAIQQVQESAFEELRREVAERRAAAAANLAEQARLEARDEQTASEIESLVAVRSTARQAADTARTEDLRRLEQLEQEKADISALLAQRAVEARRAAEAAAEAEEPESGSPAPGPAPAPAPQPGSPAPAPAASGLSSPVDGYVTSPYGMRFHPIYKVWKLHDGTDFGAPCGAPVRAAADGTVVSMYYNGGYGNRIIMDHGLRGGVGLGTTYNHLSGYAVSAGQQVRRGDVIGYVGTTGASTGCHLHFMVFEDGVTVDPMRWL